jgi:hypothetical protein
VAHSLIFGMTESGKTTLGTRLAHYYQDNERGVIILDEMCDPRWMSEKRQALMRRDPGVWRAQELMGELPPFRQFSDPDEFLDVFWDSKNCMVFIDESGDAVGKYDQAMQRTATKGRHWGHSLHYISQRGAQLNRTVRDQCSHLFLFNTAKKDAELHAHEWNAPELANANTLSKGEYFHVSRFDKDGKAGRVERGKLF